MSYWPGNGRIGFRLVFSIEKTGKLILKYLDYRYQHAMPIGIRLAVYLGKCRLLINKHKLLEIRAIKGRNAFINFAIFGTYPKVKVNCMSRITT